MKTSITLLIILKLLPCITCFTSPLTFSSLQKTQTTKHYMFGGAGSTPLDDDEEDEEKEKQIEQAAKAMGFSVNEYKLVLRMQNNLANTVNALRVSGGDLDKKGVSITMDGYSPPKFVNVEINDMGKEKGKSAFTKEVLAALKEASEKAKKEQQAAIQKMNSDIAEEMKRTGMA